MWAGREIPFLLLGAVGPVRAVPVQTGFWIEMTMRVRGSKRAAIYIEGQCCAADRPSHAPRLLFDGSLDDM